MTKIYPPTIKQSAVKNFGWLDLAILFLALLVILVGIGSYGLYEPHEGHFAMISQEMIWRNDWVTPHLNGSPYLNKPPLLYWLIALSTKIFGSTEFAARFPLALVGWLGIILAGNWARELWGIIAGRTAALMLTVTLGWFIFTHQILIDVLLGTLLLSSNYWLWRCLARPSGLFLDQPRVWFNWLGLYTSLACCVLTKGLIGVVFPLIGIAALIIVRRDGRIIRQIKLYQGLLLVMAIVLPWFIAVEQANPGFLHYFLVNEHFARLLDRRFPPDYEVSKTSALGYLGITACWCFPWILFLPTVIKSTWHEWRQGLRDNASVLERHHSDGLFLLATGAILPVILFLPVDSRLIYYSIPAIPPYIILCAGWWSKNRQKQAVTQQQFQMNDYPARKTISKQDSLTVGILSRPAIEIEKTREQYLNKHNIAKLYGAIASIIGICIYSAFAFQSLILSLLPTVMQTTEIARLIIVVAIALGTGWFTSGIAMVKRSDWGSMALIPLFVALTVTYLATVRGFYLYQDLRSSKSLVQQANSCLSVDTLWIFEGSREIGAAGAISYYLNQPPEANTTNKASNLVTESTDLYRTVMVLADGGENRIPPQFPGSKPKYLINQAELENYWQSDRPTVFMTDFLRLPNDPQDPLTLNLPQGEDIPWLENGQRKLYLNQAAVALANQRCS